MPSRNPKGRGRPAEWSWREIINAIFYVTRSGCQWRMLPHNFPPWGTVYHYFRLWRKNGTWQKIHDRLRERTRNQEGRKKRPTAAIIDSQSIKTTEMGRLRGFDAAKNVNGRKRHLIVDTLGLLLAVVVHSAKIQDYDGGKFVLKRLLKYFSTIQHIWADQRYAGKFINWAKEHCLLDIEVVKRPKEATGFILLHRRWVVERTFGWLGRSRRLSKDYERQPKNSEAFIQIAMIHLMLKRLY